ncbi:MAG: hypothetical protein ABIK86_06565, partial [candidate division WOR-3 bacterium]
MNLASALNLAGMSLVTSFGVSLWLTRLAGCYNWYDQPGDVLKIHLRPIPMVGGFGVYIAFSLVALTQPGAAVLAGLGLVALVLGAWDDFHWKSRTVPGTKFLVQAAGTVAMLVLLWVTGVRLEGAPAWVFWLLGSGFVAGGMNALNLEDGMDGLAAGEAVLSALGFSLLLHHQGLFGPALAGVALAGALVGFLALNWHPAR